MNHTEVNDFINKTHIHFEKAREVADNTLYPLLSTKERAVEYALCIVLDIIKWTKEKNMPSSYVAEKFYRLQDELKELSLI